MIKNSLNKSLLILYKLECILIYTDRNLVFRYLQENILI